MAVPAPLAYLEVDDELTSAAERIRTATGPSLALVLPAGSRLGTSRLNFRILAREAERRSIALAIVSPEPATLALVAAAGLGGYATVPELEAAIEAGDGSELRRTDGAGERTARDRTPGGPAVAAEDRESEPSSPSRRERRAMVEGAGGGARRTVGALLALLAIAALGLGGVYLATPALSSATIRLVVAAVPLEPIELTVVADPAAAASDPGSGTIPAEPRLLPLVARGTFPATGVKVVETPATGSVRWTNCDPTRAYRLPDGTAVRTRDGIGFRTAEEIFLPVATLTGTPPRITCMTREVGVAAAVDGTTGNVATGAISVIPSSYNPVVLRVTNPAATAGGTRTETPRVEEADVAAAIEALTAQLDEELATDADRLAAEGGAAIVFAATATRDEPALDPPEGELVGREATSFELSLTATGRVLAVDPALARGLAEARLRAAVPAGSELVASSLSIEVGDGRVANGVVELPVRASGAAVRRVEEGAVVAAVAGLPLGDARAALAELGEGTVELSPPWATDLPGPASGRVAVEIAYEEAGSP